MLIIQGYLKQLTVGQFVDVTAEDTDNLFGNIEYIYDFNRYDY